jgi:protein ImuB
MTLEDPDSTSQLPLPSAGSMPAATTAKIISLPQRAGAVTAKTATTSRAASHALRRRRSTLWYALYLPQLEELPQSLQRQYLNELAALVQEVSSTVSFQPLALVCEIRSSLKYFGGIDVIHRRLRQLLGKQLKQWALADCFFYAVSPTVTGSLLLARSGHNTLVYQKDNLRSALGQLPTAVLQLNQEQNRRLYNMGVRHLRDIWRLPSAGLRRRFGSDFVNQLHKALGKAPEPTRNYLPAPAFLSSYDLPYELENLERLLPVADEIFAQLCDFLRQRDLGTSQLLFSLLHEKRGCTELSIGLRQPSRSREHLMLLLETHFGNLSIPAPVTAVKLEVKQFDAFVSLSGPLFKKGGEEKRGQSKNSFSSRENMQDSDREKKGQSKNSFSPRENMQDSARNFYSDPSFPGPAFPSQLIEQLQARLGEHRVKSINNVAEHCPEYASQQADYFEFATPGKGSEAMSKQVALNPRPFWLLQQPLQLSIRRGRLYHRKAIAIVSGPERIETHGWSDTEVRRDYYVAREENGSRLWIYREKGASKHWFLHGFFA